jgi:hypothetical protein
MSIAEQSYGYEHGFGKLKTQKRFKKKIKFKPIDVIRPDMHYVFNLEEALCIYQALYQNAKPFFKNFSIYGRLQSYFEDSWNDGSPLFTGEYYTAFGNLINHLQKLFLELYGLDDVWEWRKSLHLTDEMTGFINTLELPCPPHYKGRHTMPLPPFHSFNECYDKVFAPKMKLNKKTSRMEETTERFWPLNHRMKNTKPFVKKKGVSIATYNPEKYGYFIFRIDYAFENCKSSKWEFYIHSKPGQTFFDFTIELSNIYEKLSRARSHYKYLEPVYEDGNKYCKHFHLK